MAGGALGAAMAAHHALAVGRANEAEGVEHLDAVDQQHIVKEALHVRLALTRGTRRGKGTNMRVLRVGMLSSHRAEWAAAAQGQELQGSRPWRPAQ